MDRLRDDRDELTSVMEARVVSEQNEPYLTVVGVAENAFVRKNASNNVLA